MFAHGLVTILRPLSILFVAFVCCYGAQNPDDDLCLDEFYGKIEHPEYRETGKDAVVEGEVEKIMAMTREGGMGCGYYLKGMEVGEKRERHFLLVSKDSLDSLPGGAKVRVHGKLNGEALSVTSVKDSSKLQVTEPAASPIPASSINLTVILVNFLDSTLGATPADIQGLITTNPSSLTKYYAETSNGQVAINATVKGPYRINYNGLSGCDWGTWAAAADAAAGVSSTSYRMYVLAPSGCGWAGLGLMPGKQAWIMGNYWYWQGAYCHEFGHNLGMHHARRWGSEYADHGDVMGNPSNPPHTNGAHTVQMGWLPAANLTTIAASGDFSYTLNALELNTAGTQVVKLPRLASGDNYYISYRAPIGLDAGNLEGEYQFKTTVHTYSSGANFTDLQDVCDDGHTFVDPVNQVSITQTSHTATTCTISVSYNSGVAQVNNASCISQSIPATMEVSQPYLLNVIMQNTGTSTWAAGNSYLLGSQNPQDNGTWLISRVGLNNSVAPGQSYAFSFYARSPSVPGTYNCQWQMLQDGVEWFGSPSANVAVTVGSSLQAPTITAQPASATVTVGQAASFTVAASGSAPLTYQWMKNGSAISGATGSSYTTPATTIADNGASFTVAVSNSVGSVISSSATLTVNGVALSNNAAFVSQSVPASMNGGKTYPVTVVVKNTGTSTWTTAGAYRLGSRNPYDNDTWGCHRVELSASVAPGQTYTFTFTVTAPSAAGTYNFQWGMVQDYVEWFGTLSSNAAIAVSTSSSSAWVDDALPGGAIPGSDNESWSWTSSSPSPFAGSLDHQSSSYAGMHQHYFYGATSTLTVGTGDSLFAYVYLDPANAPSEVMLQWNDGSWEHRAYWGGNQIGWGVDGTESRHRMGALPAVGQWVRLEVPASVVGLAGRTLNGMAFTLYGGHATWDYAGKAPGTVASKVWVDDTLPVGAIASSSNERTWDWITSNPTPFAGSLAHRSIGYAGGLHQHYFYGASATLTVGVGESLFAYVYLDPANPPSEVMLQWNDGTWEHRAYWGSNQAGWGTDGTESRHSMGALPPVGQWVRLQVPASAVGLDGHELNGMAFTLYGGNATWDYAGATTGTAAGMPRANG